MFAFEHDGVVPDILTLSKTLGAGLPLGATIVSHEVERVCADRGFFYYTTHLNDPLVAAVGAKVCQIIKRDRMDAQAREKGELLRLGLMGVSSSSLRLAERASGRDRTRWGPVTAANSSSKRSTPASGMCAAAG